MASKALLNGRGPLSSELGVIHMKELWRRAHRSIIIHNVALLPGCKTLNMNEWCTDRAEIIFLISIFVFWYYKMCKTKYLYTTHRLIQWYCVSFKKAFFESERDDCHCQDGSYQVCSVHLLGFQQCCPGNSASTGHKGSRSHYSWTHPFSYTQERHFCCFLNLRQLKQVNAIYVLHFFVKILNL